MHTPPKKDDGRITNKRLFSGTNDLVARKVDACNPGPGEAEIQHGLGYVVRDCLRSRKVAQLLEYIYISVPYG